ncbi:MAG: hypothetical protein RL213_1220 [Bacteroidota bacterium]|jgi:hypothetical protein
MPVLRAYFKPFLIAVLVLLSLNTFAQTWAWARKAGGQENDESQSITYDAAGNLIVVGSFKSPVCFAGTLGITNTSAFGSYDVMVIKYNSLGTVLWARGFGGTSSDYGKSVSVDPAGNIYVAGYFKSDSIFAGTDTLYNSSLNNSELFIAKFSTAGTPLWIRKVGSAGDEIAYGICTDADANSYVTGYFTSDTLLIGQDTAYKNGLGFSDLLLVKFDTYGNLVWHKEYGGTGKDIGKSVKAGPNGLLYLAGYFDSDTLRVGSTNNINRFAGTEDILLVCGDTAGNVSWSRAVGDTANERPTDLSLDGSGHLYLAGLFTSNTFTTDAVVLANAANTYTTDCFALKMSAANGHCIWGISAGGPGNDQSSGICADTSGKIYLVGRFDSNQIQFGSTVLLNFIQTGTSDIFVTCLDTSGVSQWSLSSGRELDDYCESVCANSNKIFITGFFRDSQMFFGTRSVSNTQTGFKDVYVAAITPPAPLPVELIAFSGLRTENKNVRLDWTTATEINNDHFDVERSTDGKEYVPIGTVAGAGNCSYSRSYRFTDINPSDVESFYRLRQVDFNGTEKLTEPIVIKGLSTGKPQLLCNPVCNGVLEFSVDTEVPADFSLLLLDASGREVMNIHRPVSHGSSRITEACGHLSQGVYIAVFGTGDYLSHKRIVLP